MILNRLGNKTRIAQNIIQHFPQHKAFVDMFFGAGGIFFNKPLADYNFCNDIDDEVFNLWLVVQSDKEELLRQVERLPISSSIWQYWKTNKETDSIKKAVRFLLFSNFGYMGQSDSLLIGLNNEKQSILNKIDETFMYLSKAKFLCEDFRNVLKKCHIKDKEYSKIFIYADPPYLGTGNNYQQGFKENDTIDLFDVLVNSKIRFALSEFDHPSVLELAKHHNLEVITIGERQNMKNRRAEILVVNYESPALYSLFRNQDFKSVICQ